MSQTTAQQCAYPGCEQPVAPPTSDRGAKPKYCDDASHNPLNAHRERRKREADATGQRAEETGGQPVTIGLTRAGTEETRQGPARRPTPGSAKAGSTE
jgi:hypothetical protein